MFTYPEEKKKKKKEFLSGRLVLVSNIVFLNVGQTWVTFTHSLVFFIYLYLALSFLSCSLMGTHNTFCSVNSFVIQGTSSCFPVITSYTCVTNPETYAMPLPQLLQTAQPITFHWYCSTYVKIHKGSLRQRDPHPSILLVLGALYRQ
jgi:hypothetical protein